MKKSTNAASIMASLHEVLNDVKGHTPLKSREAALDDIDVATIRRKFNVTQVEFSNLFGFSLRTLQQWEQGRRRPQGAARILLKVIDYAPDVATKALHH